MRVIISCLLSAAAFMFWTSCRRELKAADYVRYITNTDNGCKKTMQAAGWEFCMQYRPYEYVMLNENRGNPKGYPFAARKAQLQGTAWFTISMKRTDNSPSPLRYQAASLDEYNERLNYYLNDAGKDIKLVYDSDTLWPMSYVFENNYNLSPQQTMIVGFRLPKNEDKPTRNMQLSFVDRVFKNGIVNATYPKDVIERIPNLIY